MARLRSRSNAVPTTLPKCPTSIQGLDEITGGGLPQGRPTLVCGAAGSGKTLLAMQFLVGGATQYDEPGVFIAFEESVEDLVQNVASLGFDLNELTAKKKIALDHVRIERSEIEETGEYDLEALFIRLGYAIDSVGAKRIVIDTIETLFGGLSNDSILRAEIRRLFAWLKHRGVTAVITGEQGEATLTRQGLEEYVSDCVILLEHEVEAQVSTRRLRVVKYRGSAHGTNEYPFLIDEGGISVLPITSVGLTGPASTERVSTGVPRLDAMLGGKGYFRGSSVLISGTAGMGKSSLAAQFAAAAGQRRERCLYFAFEESEQQIIRNMRSIGLDLAPLVKQGLLKFVNSRATIYGLEMHLATIHKIMSEFKPQVVIFDPITNLMGIGQRHVVKSMLTRLIDFLKMGQVTALFTSLTYGGNASLEETEVGISSLMDTWLLVRDIEHDGERNRGLYVLKSRGMAHSNQVREFRLTDHGVELTDVYLGPAGVLTGSSRAQQEARDQAALMNQRQERERRRREIERRRHLLAAQIEELKLAAEAEAEELAKLEQQDAAHELVQAEDRATMARLRQADGLAVKAAQTVKPSRRAK